MEDLEMEVEDIELEIIELMELDDKDVIARVLEDDDRIMEIANPMKDDKVVKMIDEIDDDGMDTSVKVHTYQIGPEKPQLCSSYNFWK